MDTLSVPLSVKIEEWRAKSAAGTITMEEYREAVAAIRNGRLAAAAPTSKAKAKPKANIDDLLGELDGIG